MTDYVDVIDTYIPPLIGVVAVALVLLRVNARRKGEPLQPHNLTSSPFPPAFLSAVGAWSIFEWVETALKSPGGLMAWMPAVIVATLAGYMSYRGQKAAGGESLQLKSMVPTFVAGLLVLKWVLELEEEQILTPEEIKAAKKAAKKATTTAVKTVGVTLGLNKDLISENLPLIVVALVVVLMATSFYRGHGPIHHEMKSGAFPWSFMSVLGVFACMSFYRDIAVQDGAYIDDVLPGLAMAAVSGGMSYVGYRMQG